MEGNSIVEFQIKAPNFSWKLISLWMFEEQDVQEVWMVADREVGKGESGVQVKGLKC